MPGRPLTVAKVYMEAFFCTEWKGQVQQGGMSWLQLPSGSCSIPANVGNSWDKSAIKELYHHSFSYCPYTSQPCAAASCSAEAAGKLLPPSSTPFPLPLLQSRRNSLYWYLSRLREKSAVGWCLLTLGQISDGSLCVQRNIDSNLDFFVCCLDCKSIRKQRCLATNFYCILQTACSVA